MRSAFVALSSLAFALPAAAHLEIQAGKLPFIDDAGGVAGGNSTWGIVMPGTGIKPFLRVCEESYDPNPVGGTTASFAIPRDDGSLLVGGFLGTYVSTDLGCTLEPVAAPLAGHAASAVVRAAGKLYVATFDIQTANGIYASDDDGQTWSTALDPVADMSFFQLAANADGSRLVATGNVITDAGTDPAVVVSLDGGATWEDVSAAYAAFDLVRATTFAEDGETILLGGSQIADGQPRGHVLRSAPPYTSPETLDTFPSEVTHVAIDAGVIVALARLRSELFRQSAPDQGFVLVNDLNAASAETPGPSDCVFGRAGGGFIGCSRQSLGSLGLFVESDDGITWTPLITFDDVGYRVCPQGTVGFAKCASYFETLCFDDTDEDVDGLTDCEDDDCLEACAANEGEGEGEPGEGEGEGEPSEGEGEGEEPTCASAGPSTMLAGVAFAALLRRRTVRARGASSRG